MSVNNIEQIDSGFSVPQRATKSLFYEMSYGDTSRVVYTLKDKDHKGYKSLYKLYMEERDILEHTFANKYFESYEHWQLVSETSWLKPLVEKWREELELVLKAEALSNIIAVSKDPEHKSHYEASKYLLNSPWRGPTDNRGRPSRQKIKEAAEDLFSKHQTFKQDHERIFS
jgi:hypothetical protein